MAVSYAQAAKGATTYSAASRASSSKVTSGAATPANGTASEATSSGNWADDVEASIGEKPNSTQKQEQEESKVQQPRDNIVERTKLADKTEEGPSGTSSPDLAASNSGSTTTKEDDAISAQTGALSESTSDTKSQTSEPAWIAERKQRQNGAQAESAVEKSDKKSKEAPLPTLPKAPVLQEAAPPAVNVWAQRMAKASALPKPATNATAAEPTSLKENQRPSAPRRKASSVSAIQRETIAINEGENKKPGAPRLDANGGRSDSPLTGASKANSTDRTSERPPTVPFSAVKDDVSWPTPESVPDKERIASAEKEAEPQRSEEATPAGKKGKHQWQVLPVTPQFVPIELGGGKSRGPPNGERSSRPSNGKPRGPQRGSLNPNGTNDRDRDRDNSKSNPTPMNGDSTPSTQNHGSFTEDANTTPVPSKATRSSSAGARGQQKKDMLPGRRFSRQPTGDSVQPDIAEDPKQAQSKDNSFYKSFAEPRRTKSPKKMSPSAENMGDDFVPKPIPRRSSVGTQTEDVGDNLESANRDGLPTRPDALESRKESRNSESTRDSNHQSSRGSNKPRGGRGRGGGGLARDFTNGHSPYVAANGFAEYTNASPYGGALSPGSLQRGNHQFSYPPPRGGGPFRGNPRSQSIPVDNYYGHNPRTGYPPHPMQGIQTFVPGMYEMNSYPMSAMPYTPQMETEQLMLNLTTQMEYYFSVNNLIKDMFLRQRMDSQGFVFLDVIANFNRIKQLTQDKELLKAVCHNSQVIEIAFGEDGKERLRKHEGWEQFCLPMEQREPTAQNPGPERLERIERPQLILNHIPAQFRGPASAGLPTLHQRFDRRSYDSAYGMSNGYPSHFTPYPGYPEHMYNESVNGDEPRGRSAKSPIYENVTSPVEQQPTAAMSNAEFELDVYPDEQINNLTVVVKSLEEAESQEQPPYHSAASRTFSNGSIDSRTFTSEKDKPSGTKSPLPNGDPLVNGSDSKLNLTRTLSPNKQQTNARDISNPDANIFWVKDQDTPLENLPAHLTPEPYVELRNRALEDRSRAVTGNCPYDLEVLYQFWCHFLVRNFNNSMYSEFKLYADEDAQKRYCFTGLKNLVQFYSQSLSHSNLIRDRVVKDYVALVQNEPPKMEAAAFKSLRSAWRNGALNLQNRKKLVNALDSTLKEQLDRVEA